MSLSLVLFAAALQLCGYVEIDPCLVQSYCVVREGSIDSRQTTRMLTADACRRCIRAPPVSYVRDGLDQYHGMEAPTAREFRSRLAGASPPSRSNQMRILHMFCTCGEGGTTREVLAIRIVHATNKGLCEKHRIVEYNQCCECGRRYVAARRKKASGVCAAKRFLKQQAYHHSS
jgi:hypothetical protein